MAASVHIPGSSTVTVRGDDLIEVVLRGYADANMLREAIDRTRRALGDRTVRFVFFQVSNVTGFSPEVGAPGAELLSMLRKQGVELAIACTRSSAIRMMGQTIAFAAGLPLRFVDNEMEAMRTFSRRRSG
jgi:hypothetical protein